MLKWQKISKCWQFFQCLKNVVIFKVNFFLTEAKKKNNFHCPSELLHDCFSMIFKRFLLGLGLVALLLFKPEIYNQKEQGNAQTSDNIHSFRSLQIKKRSYGMGMPNCLESISPRIWINSMPMQSMGQNPTGSTDLCFQFQDLSNSLSHIIFQNHLKFQHFFISVLLFAS